MRSVLLGRYVLTRLDAFLEVTSNAFCSVRTRSSYGGDVFWNVLTRLDVFLEATDNVFCSIKMSSSYENDAVNHRFFLWLWYFLIFLYFFKYVDYCHLVWSFGISMIMVFIWLWYFSIFWYFFLVFLLWYLLIMGYFPWCLSFSMLIVWASMLVLVL